ncbi:hypothetical protein O3P69_005751 [Scylla paramamosain]|uniref:Persulfide dioxygenase ETHE1, mitochondrial n=1 Tax=Scylla paramamosain TaxID=85552 RepID=A0AAW0UA82_SCYPA
MLKPFPVHSETGLGFITMLRSVLRPGVILGGRRTPLNPHGRTICLSGREKAGTLAFSLRKFTQTRGSGVMIFRQLFDRDSCTYTYLLADPDTKEAVLVDPVIELAERDAKLVDQMGLNLIYVMNTHMHADHITGTGLLKKLVPSCQSVISKESGAMADVHVEHGEVVKFGEQELEVRQTPGHTNGCVTYVCHGEKFALTGDALLVRGCGRTDFQEGSAETLYESVHSQILSLPDDFALYPAHDYVGHTVTSVAEEKEFNPRLTKSKEEFIDLMNNLGLAYPRKIDISLPANKVCGLYNLP